jgi:hypothetical protein
MLQLTLAYVQQVTRERQVETDLQNRQILRSTRQSVAPVEPAAPSRAHRRAPVRARAAGR